MAAVARLPQGAVILPGFDWSLPQAVWDRLADPEAADHPQAGFRRLADALGFAPGDVARWTQDAPAAAARGRLVSLALRPAPVTDQWRSEGAALAPSLGEAFARLDWIEADSARAEARAIAFVLREAAETGTRAALVTPDRELARRVAAELARWGLAPDDSAGRPLALTPPGVLLGRLAALAEGPLTPAGLAALLKHPLVASGAPDRAAHRRLVEALELQTLRGGPPALAPGALAAWGAARGPEAARWAGWIEAALAPLAAVGPATLAARTAGLRAAAEALAAGPDGGAHGLWDKEAGLRARALIDRLAAEAEGFGPIGAAEFRALLASEAAAVDVPEEAVVTHGGVAIWGTLEARVQAAELVVLGGLNEGVWPRPPPADPWLSRPMRRALGLPSPERVVGLAAHDLQQALAAPRVVIARAARDAEAPTVPSRWLLRLENLARGIGPEGAAALDAARGRGAAILAAAAALDRPAAAAPPARRPAPRPPAAARPGQLSVTRIETLVRDPYAIYARHVLGLKPLKPLGRDPDALERGSALHAALRAVVDATEAELPADAAAVFERTTAAAIAAAAPWPTARALWTARLGRVAGWWLATEAERRARGRPVAREVRGRRELDGARLPFAVTAQADRIDRTPSGAYAIYDYKSGGVPSEREAQRFHLQLPLEAAIAAAGGFEGLPAAPVAHLELIGLGARATLVLDAEPEAVWVRLRGLIAAFQHPAATFPARLRPQRLVHASDYDHLSRRGEWADGDPPQVEDLA
jgi:double-strand break repair protein AddB